MSIQITENRLSQIKKSLINLCHRNGIFMSENIEEFYYDNLIETGIIDSMGVVYLQDQIETHYKVAISLEQFVGELHTLDRLVYFLAADSKVQVPI
jgi:acyl carrier protein